MFGPWPMKYVSGRSPFRFGKQTDPFRTVLLLIWHSALQSDRTLLMSISLTSLAAGAVARDITDTATRREEIRNLEENMRENYRKMMAWKYVFVAVFICISVP